MQCCVIVQVGHTFLGIAHHTNTKVPKVEDVWACDSNPSVQRWLGHVLPEAPLLRDIHDRKFVKTPGTSATSPSAMRAATTTGKTVTFTFGTRAIDMSICGFPCSPWSKRGSQLTQVSVTT